LHQAQARYKKNFDRGVSRKNSSFRGRYEACVRVEVTDVGPNHKLESLVQGLYRVVDNAGNTFRLKIGDETVRISSDRVTRAPSRNDPPADEDASPVRIRAPTPSQGSTPVSTEVIPTPDRFFSRVHDELPKVVVPSLRPPRQKRRVRFTLPDNMQVPVAQPNSPRGKWR
jgi:hypothetical protein